MKKFLIVFSLVAFVFGYAVYEAIKLDGKLVAPTSSTGTVIKEIPSAAIFTEYGDKTKTISLEKLAEGKNVFVHFWATWCAPCEKEFPELVEMIKLLKGRQDIVFALVAVNDDVKKIRKFLTQFELNYQNVVILEDLENAHKLLGTYRLPETYVFGPDRKIVKKFAGQQPWTEKRLLDFFKSL